MRRTSSSSFVCIVVALAVLAIVAPSSLSPGIIFAVFALRSTTSTNSIRKALVGKPRGGPPSTSLKVSSVAEASGILSKWDEQFVGKIPKRFDSNNIIINSKSNKYVDDDLYDLLPDAVRYLNAVAIEQRGARCILGICAENVDEGVNALKTWVTELQLPRGLLFGLDKDGVPIDKTNFMDGVYLKYNSAFARPKMRRSRRINNQSDGERDDDGDDSPRRQYKPGDVLASPYSGKYRGVYFQIELNDKTFRQYLLPANIF